MDECSNAVAMVRVFANTEAVYDVRLASGTA
jgi:hypothetical protein